MTEFKNCVDIVNPFVETMQTDHANVPYQIVGGTGSAALALAETQILVADGAVVAPADLHVPQFRDKRGRNKRDVDVLVLTTRQDHVEKVKGTLEETVGKKLKKSVFELKPASALRHAQEHPFVPNLRSFLSDRYVEMSGGRVLQQWKGLFPFMIEVDPASLETFHLHIEGNDTVTPIPHPGATLLNYLTRSVSGLRPKDMDKVLGTKDKKGMAEVVFGNPELKEWVLDGPGRNLFYLAQVLHGLRQPLDNQQPLRLAEGVVLRPIDPSTLPYDSRVFMFPTEGQEASVRGATALEIARTKSRVLHCGESKPFLVDNWQRFMETVVARIIHNN